MFKKILFTLVIVSLVFVGQALAGEDLYNKGTVLDLRTRTSLSSYDNVVGYFETADQLTIVYKATWVDSSDHLHSKPIYIGDCNYVDGYTLTVVSAASDVNPVFHFSYDNTNNWVTTTPATLDAVSNTAVSDTIGLEAGANDAKFHTAAYLVIEYQDGSTALNDGEYCIMVLTFNKDEIYIGKTMGAARIKNTSNTNP